VIRSVFFSLCVALPLASTAAQDAPVAITPDEVKWDKSGGLALAGLEQANLIGDPSKPGPYTIRVKFPAGYRLEAHTHNDARQVTILTGTWHTGYGPTFDKSKLKRLPEGSFYTEPANVPHFVETDGAVIVQVSGVGPSQRMFVAPRKK
jgi:quercetin dioxygenase-like cupin family protein